MAVLVFAFAQGWMLARGLHQNGQTISWILSATEAAAVLMVTCLVPMEARRAARPSTLVSSYLLARLISDLGEIWIHSAQPNAEHATPGSALRPCVTLALLVVFSQNKRSFLKDEYQDLPPETRAGIFSRLLVWWVTPILNLGRSKILSLEDLPCLDGTASATILRVRIQASWDHRSERCD